MQNTSPARTLDQVQQGERVKVVRVSGGRRLVHRLSGLGIVPGAVLTVLRPRGPGLVSVNGTRVAIGRQAACVIEVQEGVG